MKVFALNKVWKRFQFSTKLKQINTNASNNLKTQFKVDKVQIRITNIKRNISYIGHVGLQINKI